MFRMIIESISVITFIILAIFHNPKTVFCKIRVHEWVFIVLFFFDPFLLSDEVLRPPNLVVSDDERMLPILYGL